MAKLYIVKVEVAYGSDRHEISIYSQTDPTVNEVLEELVAKTRVPKSNIQLMFRGQRLHCNPSATLSSFGIFSGNQLKMVGERLSPADDAIFRRVLGIEKDIGLIEKNSDCVLREFTMMENGGLELNLTAEYLPQLCQRAQRMISDLETFSRVLDELDVAKIAQCDVKERHQRLQKRIENNIQQLKLLCQRMENFKK